MCPAGGVESNNSLRCTRVIVHLLVPRARPPPAVRLTPYSSRVCFGRCWAWTDRGEEANMGYFKLFYTVRSQPCAECITLTGARFVTQHTQVRVASVVERVWMSSHGRQPEPAQPRTRTNHPGRERESVSESVLRNIHTYRSEWQTRTKSPGRTGARHSGHSGLCTTHSCTHSLCPAAHATRTHPSAAQNQLHHVDESTPTAPHCL